MEIIKMPIMIKIIISIYQAVTAIRQPSSVLIPKVATILNPFYK